MYHLADLQLNPSAGTVVRNGQDLRLSRLNFATLRTLVERSPELVTVDELLDAVWGETVVNEETVKQRIKLLRQALGDSSASPKYIDVVRGRGYRLVPLVSRAGDEVADVNDDEKSRPGFKVRIGALLLLTVVLATAVWMIFGKAESPVETVPEATTRLAVMPLSGSGAVDSDLEWFIDGIHEELITRLSRIEDIQVRSRASVQPFRGKGASPASVAELLDVNWILEGSVRRSQNAVRITVTLIDPILNSTTWAESYDHELTLERLLEIQADIAINVAEAVRGQLSPAEQVKLQSWETVSLEAYDAQLLGRFHVFRGRADDIRIAIDQFKLATQLDPAYIRAWEGLGWAHLMSGVSFGWRPPGPSLEDALAAARAGLALDGQDASLLNLSESILLFANGDTERALQAFNVLADNAPPLPSAWVNLAFVRSLRGEFEESVEVCRRMQALFPRDPIILVQAAWFNRAAGHAKRSLELAEKALEIDPGVWDAKLARSYALYDLGDFEGAFRGFEELDVYSGRILSLGAMGRQAEAESLLEALEKLSETTYIHPQVMALAYLGVGREEDALTEAERAAATGGRDALWMTIDPSLAPLRQYPRYQALRTSVRNKSR